MQLPVFFAKKKDSEQEIEAFLYYNEYGDKYMMILLFDYETKDVVDEFIEKYGATINNVIGSDLPLFTIYERGQIEKWKTKHLDILLKQDFGDYLVFQKRMDFMKRLAKAFNVSSFPSIVLIDTKSEETNNYRYESISLNGLNALEINNKILDITNAINHNYFDFNKIIKNFQNKIIDRKSKTESGYALYNIFTHEGYYKEHLKKYGLTNLEDFSRKLMGIEYGTFHHCLVRSDYNSGERRCKRKFSRDRIIAICIFLEEDIYGINYYLKADYDSKFPSGDREERIKELIDRHYNLIEINDLLEKEGFKPLTKPKEFKEYKRAE